MADRPVLVRLAWFFGLWLAGVGVVGLVGFVLRSWLMP
jgi:hypothetical protein